jgi:lipopolysaccharide export system permease protein
LTLTGFVCVILVVDLIENLDRFIDNAIPAKITLKYYIYAIPWFLNIGLPMSMLISTVFSIGLLAKRNELTAMKATGISLYRIALPITVIGLIVSFISFFCRKTLRRSVWCLTRERRFMYSRSIL